MARSLDGTGVFPCQRFQRTEPETVIEHQRIGKAAHGTGLGSWSLRHPFLRVRPRRQRLRHRLGVGRHHRLCRRAARIRDCEGEERSASSRSGDQQPRGGFNQPQSGNLRADGADGTHPRGTGQPIESAAKSQRHGGAPRHRRCDTCPTTQKQIGQAAQQAPVQLHRHHRIR